ncbi:MAG: regulatory protein RecX [Succiniclasticum sp.]|jgi:regulatory protein
MFRKASKSLTTSDEVYEYALTLLDRRDYAAVDLEKRLRQRGAPEDLIQETVARLRRCDLLNEERYARRVFEAWRSKKYYGRLHLQAEFKKKNVDARYIPALLDEFTEEEERERALAAYRQTRNRRDGRYDCTTEKGVAALIRYLTARGFGGSLIHLVLQQARRDLEDDATAGEDSPLQNVTDQANP